MLRPPYFRRIPCDLTAASARLQDKTSQFSAPQFFDPRREYVDGKVQRVGDFSVRVWPGIPPIFEDEGLASAEIFMHFCERL